jgi:ankyrin repeat protein
MNHNYLVLLVVLYAQTGLSAETNNLFSAAISGNIERVKSILSEGTNVNTQTDIGRTAMMAASFNGNIRVIRLLLAYGADVNLADNLGTTALMDAVMFGNETLVNLLITAGADITAQDKQNVSVIDKAKKTTHDHIVKLLEKEITKLEEKAAAEKAETDSESEETKEK